MVALTACDFSGQGGVFTSVSSDATVSSSVSGGGGSSASSGDAADSSDGAISSDPASAQDSSGSGVEPADSSSSGGGQSSSDGGQSSSDGGQSSSGSQQGGDVEPENDFTITCTLGTPNAYRVTEGEGGEKTITFTTINEKTEYLFEGVLNGNIVIDVGNANKFELGLGGATITSAKNCPIVALSGDECTISSKNGTKNYINDNRNALPEDSEDRSACIYSAVDLTMSGKGELTVISKANNGIHGKDDVEIKNVTMKVKCVNNAIKGNDSVTVLSGDLSLIAVQGDGIKTSNSGISNKGNQKGAVRIEGGTVNVYSARDGIDSAYDVVVTGESVLNVFTDKYSEYSEEITDVAEGYYYIRSTVTTYNYSIKYYNSDTDYVWKNAVYDSFIRSGRNTYYYYKIDKAATYDRFNVYAYTSGQTQGQDGTYAAKADGKTQNDSYDTISVTVSGTNIATSWTNYGTTGGPGGMFDGNTDKGDYSTKGIKAANAVMLSGGTVNIKSYDDAINAGSDESLENGSLPTGNVTITSCTLDIYSNDDGIHADGTLTISSGKVTISNCYEGMEAARVTISGGTVTVIAKDDGINGSAGSGTTITVSGGYLYVYAGGDGIDSNSSTSGQGISFEGGKTVVVTTSSNNSCIDSERGYKYSGGYVLGICPQGMTSEVNNVTVTNGARSNSTSMGDLTTANYVTIANVVTVKMPANVTRSFAIYLGPASANITKTTSTSYTLDDNGVYWNVN